MQKLGNVNAAGVAKLYRNKTLVGTCADTPNAIACCIGNNKATSAKNMFGEKVVVGGDRVENKGWMTLKQSCFVGK